MVKSTLLLLLGLSLSVSCWGMSGLIGGRDTLIENVGYTASVTLSDGSYCVAAVINNRTLLTAAHCLAGFKLEDLKLRIGSNYRYKEGGWYGVKEFVLHPNFNPETLENDVAMIRTGGFINIGLDIKTVDLPKMKQELPYTSLAVISGFGTSSKDAATEEILKAAILPVMQPGLCTAIFVFDLADTMFCAGTFNERYDACSEVAGTPLVVLDTLVGIAVSGSSCDKPFLPGRYTNVALVMDWIDEALSKFRN